MSGKDEKYLKVGVADKEFDILDELYFVISYQLLTSKLEIEELELKNQLIQMFHKGWIQFFVELDGISNPYVLSEDLSFENLYFLATKKGLLLHNQI